VALVLVSAWFLRAAYTQVLTTANRLPGGAAGPPAVPFEAQELNTPFHIRKKCEAQGWLMGRAGHAQTKATPDGAVAGFEGYVVRSPAGETAVATVTRFKEDVTAEAFAAGVSHDLLVARDGQYVFYVTPQGRKPAPFDHEVYDVVRRPLQVLTPPP
jgi:hypothetical protein